MTPWTVAHQAPPSMGFSRQEYWSGVPSPSLFKCTWNTRLTMYWIIRASLVAQRERIHLSCRRPWCDSWVGKICWRRDRLPTPVFLGFPGGSDGKASTHNAETWAQSLGWEDPLEEGMATHSSILSWKIPWTEEPGGLQSMGLQRVGHN